MIDFEFLLSAINLLINAVTLILFVIYAKDTWNLANTTLATTEETAKTADITIESVKVISETLDEHLQYKDVQIAPMVFAFLEPDKEHPRHIYLTIRNCGKGVARDVEVSFTPALKPSEHFDLAHIKQLTEFIPILPPNKFIKHGFVYINEEYLECKENPLIYKVLIKFKGGIYDYQREFKQEISLDFFTRGSLANQISEIT